MRTCWGEKCGEAEVRREKVKEQGTREKEQGTSAVEKS